MIGPGLSSHHPHYRRGRRRLLPFLVAFFWAPLACSNDQPSENSLGLPTPYVGRRHPYLTVTDTAGGSSETVSPKMLVASEYRP